jgi:hypothetical protein
MGFDYNNTQVVQQGGKRFVRKVSIKNGKGHKSVKYYKNGRMVSTIKKGLNPVEVGFIKIGKFIPGLFKDCPCNKTKKHRK